MSAHGKIRRGGKRRRGAETAVHCPDCSRIFGSESALDNHWNAKHAAVEEYQYSCCGRSFRRYDDYDRHFKAKHIPRFQCHCCARTFTTATARDDHYYTCYPEVRVPPSRPAAAASLTCRPAAVVAPHAAAGNHDNGDDDAAVVEVREESLDERLAAAKQAAAARGDFIDLTTQEPQPGEPGYRRRQQKIFEKAWRAWTAADPSRRIRPAGARWFSVCGLRWTDDETLQKKIDDEENEVAAFFSHHAEALHMMDAEQAVEADRTRMLAEVDAHENESRVEQRCQSWLADVSEHLAVNDDAVQIATNEQERHDANAAVEQDRSDEQRAILAQADAAWRNDVSMDHTEVAEPARGDPYTHSARIYEEARTFFETHKEALRVASREHCNDETDIILDEHDALTARSFPGPGDLFDDDPIVEFLDENDDALKESYEYSTANRLTFLAYAEPRHGSWRMRCDVYGIWH